MKLNQCNTISDIINYEKTLSISHNKLHFKSSLTDKDGNTIIVNSLALFDKYYDFITPTIVQVELSDTEYSEFAMNPKMLSYKLYGTTELWSAILSVNNLTSAAEFTIKKIKVFSTDIFDVLNEILILEEANIKKNYTENNI